ncbi:MAG TPA: macrolide ABC transporter ATP-binding protein [Deltaproteobacteria bacterium]|jgi:putative ABC transport system ATP-binding protein|nr:macrolide ABC transporter ATP-binding protein [Deltaproteobacteria bacterium]
MAICQLDHASRHYGSGETLVKAADAVSLSIEAGEFTVLSGPSGSGKTTVLNLVGLLDQPTDGTVSIQGTATGTLSDRALTQLRAASIGFIYQSFNLVPVLSAVENVELALNLAGITPPGGARAAATKALEDVGLGELLHRRPNQLSGGQQQRVAIARALVKAPVLVIADEPTANLDSQSGTRVLDLMRALNEERGVTFLFSTHDPMVIERARRVVHMKDGRVHEDIRASSGEA